MKVHDYKGFPNPARVRIALAEKGLLDEVEFVTVDVPAGEHRKPEFLKLNPSGAVPVLEFEDGETLSECSAITDYLDHARGEPVLTGLDARERGRIAMIQRKVEAGLLDAVAAYFHLATDGLGPHIEAYRNEDYGRHQKERALATMRWMDDLLADRPHLAGERFTMADITGMAGMAFADFVGLAMPADLARLAAWRDRVAARPSAAAAA